MDVTLRKGHKLACQLLALLDTTATPTQLAIPLYKLPMDEDAINVSVKTSGTEALDTLIASVKLQEDIIQAAYTLRRLQDDKHHESGVSKLLNEKAALQKAAQVYETVVATGGLGVDPDFASARVAEMRAQAAAATAMGRSAQGEISFRVVGKVFMEKFADTARGYRTRLVQIEDELLALNMATRIELPDQVVSVLKTVKLM